MSLNYIVLSGQLAQDSEVRYTVSGQPILQFSLAVSSGEPADETNYIRVVSRRESASLMTHQLKKGTHVLVEGQLLTRTFTKKSGFQQKSVEINLEHLKILPEEK